MSGTRPLTAAMLTALTSQHHRIGHFLRVEFATTTLRLTDIYVPGGAFITWTPPGESSQQWAHFGGEFGFTPLVESADTETHNLEVRLSGVDTTVAGLPSNEGYLNREVSLWLAALDATALTIIADPILLFRGHMNGGFEYSEDLEDDRAVATVKMRVVSEFQVLREQMGIRCNVSSHQAHFADDVFFSFVPSLRGQGKLYWG